VFETGTDPRKAATKKRLYAKAKLGHVPVMDNIIKKGKIIFRAGKTAVRDNGVKLQVSHKTARDCLQ